MSLQTLVNIAPSAHVSFSSTSKWSKPDDNKEILTAEHNRDFSFHTDYERNPWIELDFGKIFIIEKIIIFNRKNSCQERAYNIRIEFSRNKIDYELIHKGFILFNKDFEFNIGGLKSARYIKFTNDEINYFHLSKIEVYIDKIKNNLLISDNRSIHDYITFSTFYIGSCRYMKLFPKHFPARLHTTKEIINFIHHYNKIDINMKDINYIYGDLLHPIVYRDSIKYYNIMHNIFDSVEMIFLEITSRKYIYIYDNVYNNFYYNNNGDKRFNIIDDEELYSDILYIKYLVKYMFNIKKIVIIPHINLLLDNGHKIKGRDNLKQSLNKICDKLDIEFLDINNAFPENSYFKDFAPDTRHYSQQGVEFVSKYITNYFDYITRYMNSRDEDSVKKNLIPDILHDS